MKTLDGLRAAFIGAGAMGSALIAAAVKALSPERVVAADADRDKREAAAEKFGVAAVKSNAEAARRSDVIVLAVKPRLAAAVTREIAPELRDKILVSVAAGVRSASLREAAGSPGPAAVARVMPNVCAACGEGMFALAAPRTEGEGRRAADIVRELFASAGRFEEIPESLMDCAGAVSGSGPAYAFVFIEALADAAVQMGMARDAAYVFAAQTLRGAGTLVLQSGKHPAALKDTVCSPGGTTIEALRALEAGGFRRTVMEAAIRAGKKSAALGAV